MTHLIALQSKEKEKFPQKHRTFPLKIDHLQVVSVSLSNKNNTNIYGNPKIIHTKRKKSLWYEK